MSSVSNLTIIIPTYNRPQLVRRLLHYYNKLNCLHKIIIADSSFIPESKENRKIIEYFRDKLDIYYNIHFSSECRVDNFKSADIVLRTNTKCFNSNNCNITNWEDLYCYTI